MTGSYRKAGAGVDFDPSTLDELRALVGAKSLASFLERLRDQMAASFEAPPLEAAGIAAAAQEANALSSASGMLGFRALSNASAALETACGSPLATPGTIVPPLADVLAARARAQQILEDLLRLYGVGGRTRTGTS